MSYCRFKDGDVYIYATSDGSKKLILVCCSCRLTAKFILEGKDADYTAEATKQKDVAKKMLVHLKEHQEAKHKVPQKAIDRLNEEAGK